MKKILLLLAATPLMVFGMDTQKSMPNADKMDKFLTMEQRHMTEWLDHKKAKYDAKIEMMKKHLDEIIDLKRQGLAQLNAGTDLKTYMADAINKWVSLHEAQTKEWREFHDSYHAKAKAIDASHKGELTSFKGDLKSTSRQTIMPMTQPMQSSSAPTTAEMIAAGAK